MFKIIQIDENNKNIVVLNTATNTKKTYKTTRELRTLYDKSPEQCENFKFDERGFRYMPKGQKKENLDVSDIREVKNKLDSVVSMLRQLNTQTNTNFQVLDKNTEQSVEKVLTEISVTMKKMLEVLDKKTDAIDKKIDNITNLLKDSNDRVYNEVKKLGMTFDEFEEKFEEITKELLDNTSTDNKFPRTDDLDSYDCYASKSIFDINDNGIYADLLTNEHEDVRLKRYLLPMETNMVEQTLPNGKDRYMPVNHVYLSILYGHLKQMNDASIAIEKQFMKDVDSKKNERTNNTKSAIVTTGATIMTTTVASVLLNPALLSLATSAFVVTSVKIASSAKNVSLSKVNSYRKSNMDGKLYNKVTRANYDKNVKDIELDDVANVNDMSDSTVLPCLKVIDKPLLQSNVQQYSYYIADIRNFRLLTLSCQYKKRGLFLSGKNPKLKHYEDYLRGSLFESKDFTDKALFRFYCDYYLSQEVSESNNIITQSEVDKRKQLMLAFINAYFAVKIMYIPIVQKRPDLCYDFNDIKNMDNWYMKYFLTGIKYGLVEQQIRVVTADKLILEFLKVNGVSL